MYSSNNDVVYFVEFDGADSVQYRDNYNAPDRLTSIGGLPLTMAPSFAVTTSRPNNTADTVVQPVGIQIGLPAGWASGGQVLLTSSLIDVFRKTLESNEALEYSIKGYRFEGDTPEEVTSYAITGHIQPHCNYKTGQLTILPIELEASLGTNRVSIKQSLRMATQAALTPLHSGRTALVSGGIVGSPGDAAASAA